MAARNEAKIKFIAETEQFTAEIKKANQTMTELRSEMKLLDARFADNENSVEALTAKKRVLQQQLETTQSKVEALRAKLEKAKAIYGETSEEVSKLKTQLNRAETQYVQTENEIKDINLALNNQEKETEETTAATKKLDSAIEKAGEGFTVMKGVIADLIADGFRLLIEGFKEISTYALNTGMDFYAGMSEVGAITGASADEMDVLTAKAMEMGATTKFSASEASEAFKYMAMAGWGVEDMVAGIDGVLNLAAASGADLATTSDIVTDALTAMGYSAGDAARFADVMAAASSSANTNVELMGYTFKYVAPVAGALGYSIEDVAIATGLMANAGIKGEMAGTQLRAGLTNLAKPTEAMATIMEEYGISLTNADGSMKTMMEVMLDLRERMGGLTEAEQANVVATLFGKEAMSGWLAIINASDEDFNKLTEDIYGSEGAALEMATVMQDNLAGDVEQLGGALETLAINGFGVFNDALRTGVQAITGFVSGASSLSEMFAGLKTAVSMAFEAIRGYLPEIGAIGLELISMLVQGIVNGLPKIATTAMGILTSLANGIASNAQKILEMGGQLIGGIVSSIVKALPGLFDAAKGIVSSLASGITGNTESFISTGLDLLESFSQTILTKVPELVQKGMELLRGLIKGIMNSLPELIARVPEIISNFANAINNSAPIIIKGGITIIKDLIVGLIKAIPTLIQNIPKILSAIVDVFTAFNWLNLGKTIITGIKNGIVAMVNSVKGAATKISSAIQSAFSNIGSWFKGIFSSAWNGVKSVFSGTGSFFSGIWSNIKGIFSGVGSWFKGVFQGAWTAIKNVFSGWGSFFSGLWSKISNTFSNIGTKISGAISNAVVSGLNGVISAIESIINKGIGLINGAIGLINKIPGVSIGTIGTLSLPRLARGGVLYGETAFIGGEYSGARTNPEIVTPQQIMRETFEDALNAHFESGLNLDRLADAIEKLASRAINIDIDGMRFATATAGATDNVSGTRLNLRNRGLAL